MTDWPIHARIDGPIVMIGFGSIGRGTLPLILRHIDCDPARITAVRSAGALVVHADIVADLRRRAVRREPHSGARL